MVSIRKLTLTTAAAAAATLVVAALSTTPALADNGGHGADNVVRASLVGSTPAPVSPVIAGVNPGAAPWVNGPSSARVRESGRTDVRIRGLIIPTLGTNPIASVVATLVCADMIADSTMPFGLSPAGNGRTRDHISVPRDCDDAVVLIQPALNRTVYIASTPTEHHDD